MKIGIVVYSQTGNTLSVASKLYEELKKEGNKVSLIRVEAKRNIKQNTFEIIKTPNVEEYDIIVFASFVEAFRLNPVMKKYLENIETLKNKNIFVFITQMLPYTWLGGNQTLKQMVNICRQKEGNIIGSGIINWKNKLRDEKTHDLIDKIVSQLKGIKQHEKKH